MTRTLIPVSLFQMSLVGKSLIDLNSLDKTTAHSLFDLALQIELKGWQKVYSEIPKLIALVFLEPSTRTTTSFEMAALRSGHKVVNLLGDSSSIRKGETLLDTLLTLNAMGPDLIVVRHGLNERLADIDRRLSSPVISAGEGVSGHPTQGLLDAYTILKERGKIEGEKVLMVGDVAHSRVAASNMELLNNLGAEVAVCGPEEWYPSQGATHTFLSLKEALEWCSVCMALRIQKERHIGTDETSYKKLVSSYQLNSLSLRALRKDGIIMHPGPFNRGVELTDEVLEDARLRIWHQVKNGVFIRGAVIAKVLGVV